jgi:hypothetical protein
MRVISGGRTILDARANAEAIEDVTTADYYAQLPQLRLFRDPTDQRARAGNEPDVILDGTDVVRVVECAIRHPNPNMRNGIASAIWNNPDAFRQIFEFGLNAPEVFGEIRRIVAEALAKRAAAAEAPAASGDKPLLPRMPLPAHLRDRGKR